jgi:hypothetical protein
MGRQVTVGLGPRARQPQWLAAKSHLLLIWGLDAANWSQEQAMMTRHGDRGMILAVEDASAHNSALPPRTVLSTVKRFCHRVCTGGIAGFQLQEDESPLCVVCFATYTAADTCAAHLEGASL